MKRPHWPLNRVKELAAKENGLYVQTGRAKAFFPSRDAALAAARGVIAALSEREFAQTVRLTWDVADVYGVQIVGAGWYFKLTVDEKVPEVAVISFHPLEHPLKTNGGVVKP